MKVKAGIDNLANFLSISPNQTNFCRLFAGPRAGLFCHSCFNLIFAVSLERLSTYVLFRF